MRVYKILRGEKYFKEDDVWWNEDEEGNEHIVICPDMIAELENL